MAAHDRFEQPPALMSMVPWHQEHSWALLNIHEHIDMTPIPLMMPWHHAYQCLWVLLSTHGALECSWALLSNSKCSSSWFSNKQKISQQQRKKFQNVFLSHNFFRTKLFLIMSNFSTHIMDSRLEFNAGVDQHVLIFLLNFRFCLTLIRNKI